MKNKKRLTVDLKVSLSKEAERTYKDKQLNLCKLLKDCIGMQFYMPHYGEVKLNLINGNMQLIFHNGCIKIGVTKEGLSGGYSCGELCVFPSKEQRDWSLFQPPWIAKKGERVWVRNGNGTWFGTYFLEFDRSFGKPVFRCYIQDSKQTSIYEQCVPFNEIPW